MDDIEFGVCAYTCERTSERTSMPVPAADAVARLPPVTPAKSEPPATPVPLPVAEACPTTGVRRPRVLEDDEDDEPDGAPPAKRARTLDESPSTASPLAVAHPVSVSITAKGRFAHIWINGVHLRAQIHKYGGYDSPEGFVEYWDVYFATDLVASDWYTGKQLIAALVALVCNRPELFLQGYAARQARKRAFDHRPLDKPPHEIRANIRDCRIGGHALIAFRIGRPQLHATRDNTYRWKVTCKHKTVLTGWFTPEELRARVLAICAASK